MTKAFPRQSWEITHLSQTSSLHLSALIRSLWLYSSPQTVYSAANNVHFFPLPSLLVATSRLEDPRLRSADRAFPLSVCWLMHLLALPAALECMCWWRDAHGLMFKLTPSHLYSAAVKAKAKLNSFIKAVWLYAVSVCARWCLNIDF